MSDKKISLGQAIDAIVEALEPLDAASQLTAINAACAHLKIPQSGQSRSTDLNGDGEKGGGETSKTSSDKQIDIRTLKEQKSPATATQMACIVAYYLQEVAPINERKQSINATDLETYFKEAKFKMPKSFKQLLVDSKAAGYFKSAGKGEYTLNAVGYNLVAHNLPKSSKNK